MGILEEMDKRIADLEALVEAFQKRLAEVEARRLQPIVIHEREGQSDRTPVVPFYQQPYQPARTWPHNPDPFKFTCQMKEDVCD